MFRFVLLFSLTQLIYCKDNIETVKLDTVHHESVRIKLNKDSIITRNLKLENRVKGRKKIDTAKHEPDWSYNVIPKEMSSYVFEFKSNMSKCLKEVQEADTRTVKRLSPKVHSPVHGECLIACVLKKNGVIEKGKVIKASLLTLVNKFFAKDTALMKKLDKHVDSCIVMSARHKDECDLAAKLNACTNDLMAHNKHKITVNY